MCVLENKLKLYVVVELEIDYNLSSIRSRLLQRIFRPQTYNLSVKLVARARTGLGRSKAPLAHCNVQVRIYFICFSV